MSLFPTNPNRPSSQAAAGGSNGYPRHRKTAATSNNSSQRHDGGASNLHRLQSPSQGSYQPTMLMESPDKSSSSYQLQSPGWSSSTLPPSVTRLWRPATQRNLRNQWSKLASYRLQWVSSSSTGRSHATSLVNTYLSLRYIPSMELGVLSDMLDLRKKASSKLLKQQELYRRKLLSSYRDLSS